jgi:hypothetical protein
VRRCPRRSIPLSLAAKGFPDPATGMDMAEHGTPEYSTAPGNDHIQHQGMYVDFLKIVKWSIILVVIVLSGMFLFLT